jgi:hypothetical protein
MKKLLLITGLFVGLLVVISCEEEDVIDGGGNQQDIAAKFLGTWDVSDQAARINYVVTIERHPLYADQVRLMNFADAGGSADATILNNTLLLEEQSVGSGFKVDGTGLYINTKRLQFEFMLDDGIDNLPRKAVFTK